MDAINRAATANYETIGNWINRSRQGDRDAFAHLVRQYQGMVSGIALSRTGDIHQSEDLAQETFLLAWRKLPELDDVRKFPGWLCSIARNLARNAVRKKSSESEQTGTALEAQFLEAPSKDADPTARLIAAEQHALVASALQNVPEKYREPLVLFYRSEQSVKQIAEALAISEETAKQRLSRARKFLRGELERRIAGVISASRPGEFFTVAVLAALPILATGNQVLAAGAAGAAAAQSASASGAGSGHSFIAGITTFFWTFFVCYLLPTIVVGVGVVLGIWSGVRNAPTLRARQLMIKVALGYFIAALALFFLFMLLVLGINYAIVNNHLVPERAPLRNFCFGVFVFLMVACPVVVIIASCLINHRWRKIVEEDLASQNFQDQTSKNSLRSVYLLGGIALFAFSVFVAFHFLAKVPWEMLCTVPTTIALFGLLLFYYAVRISKDQESFAKTPPRLPNLLAILTGEEKAPKGFHNRINFWGDLIALGWGLYVMHVVWFGFYLHYRYRNTEPIRLFVEIDGWLEVSVSAFALLLSLILLVYFLFAVFFAGIPRRRYWGMIFLGVSVMLIDFGVHFMVFDQLQTNDGMWFVYGIPAWFLLCFTLLGVSGLWVFRKKG